MKTRKAASVDTITVANSAAVSSVFEMSGAAEAIVLMPAAWTAANIGFQISDSSAGTFYKLYDEDGALVTITGPAASGAYTTPAGLTGATYVKLWSCNSTGTNVVQTAARTLKVVKKT